MGLIVTIITHAFLEGGIGLIVTPQKLQAKFLL